MVHPTSDLLAMVKKCNFKGTPVVFIAASIHRSVNLILQDPVRIQNPVHMQDTIRIHRMCVVVYCCVLLCIVVSSSDEQLSNNFH